MLAPQSLRSEKLRRFRGLDKLGAQLQDIGVFGFEVVNSLFLVGLNQANHARHQSQPVARLQRPVDIRLRLAAA